ncbi:RNA-binding protein 33 isoform X2 [Orussus abietinus]|uniref:RNA-binding protein 33 isoform X2 n=1 Tax=Orussus abietinus TaxID=222816 RepID=UPI0006268D97|nr:RNA-binding protein 33 isoform X2 [Orussus abietinus]
MSEHDDTLLDEDLGDEEYDLCNDEEEALLADDYEIGRQNSYKGEEETDDVLDLGVMDPLDDLEGEDENIEYRSETNNRNENEFYKEERHETKYYKQEEQEGFKNMQDSQSEEGPSQESGNALRDLREKLQKNSQRDFYIGNAQGLEDDDCEDAKERRNRFQNERIIVSPKMNNEIPDSLENVVTVEQPRQPFRGRGRGRGIRGTRGGRFVGQNNSNFNPRFAAPRGPSFDNQQPQFRPPLLDNRPPFLGPNTVPNQQMIYHHNNPLGGTPFQQFPSNVSMQGPMHFGENRPPFNPNQYQGPPGPPVVRVVGPRTDFGPRAPGPVAPYNCAPNQPPYMPNQVAHFQNQPVLVQENQGRPPQGNQGLMIQGNPSGHPMPGNQGPIMPGNQGMPGQIFPRAPVPPVALPPGQNHQNVPMPSQPSFENRPPFQEQFDARPSYDSRPVYNELPSINQYTTPNAPAMSQQSSPGISGMPPQPNPNIPNVPLPPGHKILINPHFRGAVQPAADARLLWDSNQHQQARLPQTPQGEQFIQSRSPYQGQANYTPTSASSTQPQTFQSQRNDDPYAYFSDVWQENKPQKPPTSSGKSYPAESGYSRSNNYENYEEKYKTENEWERRPSYQSEQIPIYRDRDPPASCNMADRLPKNCVPMVNNTYRNENYDQPQLQQPPINRPTNAPIRGANRMPLKRVPEPAEKMPRDLSPKRAKTNIRNLQEVKTIDTHNDTIHEKREEDSDPEMREYRKKLEEQKRLREKILREKENRRKMAAMEKHSEEAKTSEVITTSESTMEEVKPTVAVTGVAKSSTMTIARPAIGRGRGRPSNAQSSEETTGPGVRIVRTVPGTQPCLTNENARHMNTTISVVPTNEDTQARQLATQPGTRRVVIHKPLSASQMKMINMQKAVSNAQKQTSSSNSGVSKTTGTIVQKMADSGQQRVVSQNVSGGVCQKVVVNTQNNQRVVVQKLPGQTKKAAETTTNTVKVENLAASTSEAKIRRMCQGIGTIESIHMGERSATIVFKTQSAALLFHKKYQRKMLDLSLITVRLIPQPGGNRTTTAVLKRS